MRRCWRAGSSCIPRPRWAKWRSNICKRNKTNKRHGSGIDMEKGIFDGLKVLDCASFIAAPAAATVLSDFGADVIKIEPPGTGDPYRNLPNLPGYPHSEHNFAWMLESRNKRSLALDLSKPEGQAVLHKLAAEADVFITNYPPAARARAERGDQSLPVQGRPLADPVAAERGPAMADTGALPRA